MRVIPGMTVINPCDDVEARAAVKAAYEMEGPVYMRFGRLAAPVINDENNYKFEIGKGILMRQGSDITIVATGLMVSYALEAAEKLAAEGISAEVINIHTIKPLDEDAVIRAATETGAIVTAENHNVINGLGSSVADVLSQKKYAPLEKIGVYDLFGEVGPMDYLFEKFHLSAIDIAQAAKRAIERKENK